VVEAGAETIASSSGAHKLGDKPLLAFPRVDDQPGDLFGGSANLKLSGVGYALHNMQDTLEPRPGLASPSVSQEVPTAIRLNLLAVTLLRAWNIHMGMWQLFISWFSNAGKVNFENGKCEKKASSSRFKRRDD
jgi:hypothetical protein